jgi:DNA uptake protein ComE-like DNA-binding protein
VVADGVVFSSVLAEETLAWVNRATWADLRAAGVYPKGCTIILNERPFSSIAALAAQKGIGAKTMEALAQVKR